MLTASILDPRLSSLDIVEKELDKREILRFQFLKDQLFEIFPCADTQSPPQQLEKHPPTSTSTKSKTKKKSLLTSLIQKHAYDSTTSSDVSQLSKDIDEEIHKYFLTVIPLDGIEHFDLLQFWKDHRSSLPKLAQLSKKILCIPATSVSSERAFSHAGLLITARRSSLGPSVINKTLFVHDNYAIIKAIRVAV